MTYTINYDLITGKASSIQLNKNTSIPICEDNTDYKRFLEWNKTASTPLDLKVTIAPVVPKKPRDLAKEIDEMKVTLSKK